MSKTEKQLMKEMFEEAFTSNDLESMGGILKLGWDIKLEPYLTIAINQSNVEAVKMLLEAGANPNKINHITKTKTRTSALHEAIKVGSLEILNLLLDVPSNPSLDVDPKLDVNEEHNFYYSDIDKNYITSSAVEYALTEMNIEMIRTLIDKGANFDNSNRDFLQVSISKCFLSNGEIIPERLEIPKFILDNFKCRDMDIIHSISILVQSTIAPNSYDLCNNMIKELLNKLDDTVIKRSRGSLVHHASYNARSVDTIKLFIDAGVEFYNPAESSYPSFYSITDNKELIKVFLEKGMDPNSNIGNVPSLLYCSDNIESVKLLLDAGADIHKTFKTNIRNYVDLPISKVILSNIIYRNKADETEIIEFVKTLLKMGVDINGVVNRDGNRDGFGMYGYNFDSPLNVSINRGFSESFIKFLIESGADLEAMDYNGWMPLHFAARNGSLELAELLISSGADVNVKDKWGQTPLHWATRKNSLELTQLLISSGADVNAKADDGRTIFHIIIDLLNTYTIHPITNSEIVKFLLSSGADVNAKDNDGNTPLHIIIKGSNSDHTISIIKFLLDVGANPDAKNNLGNTPLHLLGMSKYGHSDRTTKDIAELLYNSGASIIIKNNTGRTPKTIISKSHWSVLSRYYEEIEQKMKDNLSSVVTTMTPKKTQKVVSKVDKESEIKQKLKEQLKNALKSA